MRHMDTPQRTVWCCPHRFTLRLDFAYPNSGTLYVKLLDRVGSLMYIAESLSGKFSKLSYG